MLGLTLGTVLAVRVGGPSDLYDNDQPKTVAYTADIVLHDRWVLPRDHMPSKDDVHDGRPATKPPMYNWIGAAAVGLTGRWDEWVLKLPSMLGGMVTLGVCSGMGVYLIRRRDDGPLPGDVIAGDCKAAMATVAPACWLSCYATMKLIYTARPDMVLTGFMIGAWAAGTVAMDRWTKATAGGGPESGGKRRGTFIASVVFWLCVAGAALTKGIPALLPLVYVAVSAKLVHGRWRAVNAVQWWGGVPVAVLLVGGWLWAAYRVEPGHFMDVFVMREVVDRAGEGGMGQWFGTLWRLPAWFMARFAPWSVLVVLMLLHVGRHVRAQRWFRHRLGPGGLWVLLVIGFMSLSSGKRADYLAPAYPAAATLAGYWLIVVAAKHGMNAFRATLLAMLVATGLGVYQMRGSSAAKSGLGTAVVRFAKEVRREVGGESVVFERTGYNPLQTLLGRMQPGEPTAEMVAGARWLIAPSDTAVGDEAEPVLESRLISEVLGGEAGRLTLYRLGGREDP